MNMPSFFRRFLVACLLVATTIPSGCSNPLDPVLKQIQTAIDEFVRTREAILADSVQWKGQVEKLFDSMPERVNELLEEGTLGRFVDARVKNVFDETKTSFVMVERRILGYLNGVIVALKRKKREIRDSGGVPSDTVEEIIAAVVASVDDVEPFVGSVVGQSTLKYRVQYRARVLIHSPVVFSGFGFHDRELQIRGVNGQGEQVWQANQNSRTVNTDFEFVFQPEKAGPIPHTVEKLVVTWDEQQLCSVPLQLEPEPAPKPLLKSISLKFVGEEKIPNVAFKIVLGAANGGRRPLATWNSAGEGQLWKPGKSYLAPKVQVMRRMDLAASTLLYVEVEMVERPGGQVIHRFINQGFAGPPRWYSKNHDPKWIYDVREFPRLGFVYRRGGYDKHNPLQLVRGNWKGRIRPVIEYDGRTIEFQESDYVVFQDGRAENGTRYREYLQWDGTGVLK